MYLIILLLCILAQHLKAIPVQFTMFATDNTNKLLFQLILNPTMWDIPSITTINPSATISMEQCGCSINQFQRWSNWSEPYNMLTNVYDLDPEQLSPTIWKPYYSHMLISPYQSCDQTKSSLNYGIAKHLTVNIDNILITWPASIGRTQLHIKWWWLTVHKINSAAFKINNVFVVRLTFKSNISNQWKQLIFNIINNLVIQDLNVNSNTLISNTAVNSDEWMLVRGNVCNWLTCYQNSQTWDDDALTCTAGA